MRSRSSVASPLSSHVSVIAGRPANAGWPRNVASPSPMRPWPTSSCRSRFEPSGVWESFTCSTRSRSSPIRRSRSASASSRASASATSTPDAHQWHESRQRPSRGWRSTASARARELGDRATDRPARAGGVLHAQPEVVGRELEELAERRLDELDGLVEAVARGASRRGRRPPRRRSRRPSASSRAAPRASCRARRASRLARFTR